MRRIHICLAIGTATGIGLGAVTAYTDTTTATPSVELRALDAAPTAGTKAGQPSSTTSVLEVVDVVPKGPPATHPSEEAVADTPAPTPSGRGPGSDGDTVPTAAASRGWRLVASDDFNGSSVDRSRWTVYNGAGNGGVGLRRPEALSVSNGTLKITGRGDVSGGMNWIGGRTYGRWEIRARTDAGNGYAPNLLLWPTSGNWPTEGEVNIMEIPRGDRQQSLFVIHWGPENNQVHHRAHGDFTRWHTFALEWLPTHITLFVDGQPIYTNRDPEIMQALSHPMHLAIQNDVGPFNDFIPPRDSTTPDRVSLEVDWVRIYAPD